MDVHSPTIDTLSFGFSLLFAVIIFVSIHKFHIKEVNRWAIPFGRTFIALAVMYLLIITAWLFETHLVLSVDKNWLKFGLIICSSFSNYFLIQAALALWSQEVWSSVKDKSYLKPILIACLTPPIIHGATLIVRSFISNSSELIFWIARDLDLFISAIALGFAGLAFHRTISSRNVIDPSFYIAKVALICGVGYALLHVAVAVAPSLENYRVFISFFALGFKIVIFFSAFALLLSIINSAKNIKRFLEKVIDKKKEIIESDGLVQVICESLKASRVDLCIKIPGIKRNLAAVYSSPAPKQYHQDPNKVPLVISLKERKVFRNPLKHELDSDVIIQEKDQEKSQQRKFGIFADVIRNTKEVTFNVLGYPDPANILNLTNPIKTDQSEICIPIRFHGAGIGCLYLALEDKQRFSDSDIQQVREIVYLIAPMVQSYREIAALDQLVSRLASLPIDESLPKPSKVSEEIVSIFFDKLNPLAIYISTNIGFSEIARPPVSIEWEKIKSFSTDLIVPSTKIEESGRIIGELTLLVIADKDEASSPALGTYHLYRRVISNLIANAILTSVRNHFTKVMRDLSVALNKPAINSPEDWFSCVRDAALEAEIAWIVLSSPGTGTVFDGKQAQNIVNRLKALEDLPEPPDNAGFYFKNKEDKMVFRYEQTKDSHPVVPLYLKDSKRTIWLGIENPKFGQELDYQSPWRVFLERYAQVADAALNRINVATEIAQIAAEIAQINAMTTPLITNHILIHDIKRELINLANQLNSLSQVVNENNIDIKKVSNKIASLERISAQLKNFCQMFKPVRPDKKSACLLSRAIENAIESKKGGLEQDCKIEFETKIIPDNLKANELKVGIMYEHAEMVLRILVQNSIDAIKKVPNQSGSITVTVGKEGELIFCRVTDDGEGVSSDLIDKLLIEPGVSSNGEDRGDGLYLAQCIMRSYSGYIEPPKSSCSPKAFTIYFRKSQNESKRFKLIEFKP